MTRRHRVVRKFVRSNARVVYFGLVDKLNLLVKARRESLSLRLDSVLCRFTTDLEEQLSDVVNLLYLGQHNHGDVDDLAAHSHDGGACQPSTDVPIPKLSRANQLVQEFSLECISHFVSPPSEADIQKLTVYPVSYNENAGHGDPTHPPFS